jgi:signal transduction histidine kinase
MSRSDDDLSTGSILRELIVNQYQAIVLGGVALASALTVSPLPLLLWAGAELVLLPVLDSGPLRRLVHRKRREKVRAQEAQQRAALVASFHSTNARRYQALENLCRMIEANYQSLTGISQAYLSEQRGKLDHILEGCVSRMLALQRYEKMPYLRQPDDLRMDIAALEHEVKDPELTDRARAALLKNLELKRRLLESYSEVGGTMRALETELDSMASLLEVLHQNSISLRDPQAIAEELDTIVEQSEHSEKVVREMEALLRSDAGTWSSTDSAPITPTRGEPSSSGRSRQKESRR